MNSALNNYCCTNLGAVRVVRGGEREVLAVVASQQQAHHRVRRRVSRVPDVELRRRYLKRKLVHLCFTQTVSDKAYRVRRQRNVLDAGILEASNSRNQLGISGKTVYVEYVRVPIGIGLALQCCRVHRREVRFV